jgi:hypothetical protein
VPRELDRLAHEQTARAEHHRRGHQEALVELLDRFDGVGGRGLTAAGRSTMRKATTRSGSSPSSKYSPPPATAICTSELRSSDERTTGGGRVPSAWSGSGIMPPTLVPMPTT